MIPIFKSHYSIGKSILTLEPSSKEPNKNGSDSIFQLCKDNNIQRVYLVEDSFGGALEAFENAKESNVELRFGWQVSCVSNVENKDDEEWETSHKLIIFCDSYKSYSNLVKLYTIANTEFACNGKARVDLNFLKNEWRDDFFLAIPFYDSFIYRNIMEKGRCIFNKITNNIVAFTENNDMPFDYLIRKNIEQYCLSNGIETIEAKSIYYKDRKDFNAFTVYKCMNRKTFGSGNSLDKPNIDHFGSEEFCFESFLENQKR